MYPAPHNLVVIYGKILQGNLQEDIWQTTLRIASGPGTPGTATGAQAQAIADAVRTDVATWWGAIGNWVPDTVIWSGVKVNAVGTDGKYLSQNTVFSEPASPQAGGQSVPALPGQVALVATLLTDANRGHASKGRMYLPPLTVNAVATGGSLSTTARDVIQPATAQLLTNLNNWPGLDAAADPGDVHVMSKVGAGTMRKVTGVSIGLRFDVQRRRANKVREVRTAASAVQ